MAVRRDEPSEFRADGILVPPSRKLQSTFRSLADTWRRETGHFSDDSRKMSHPAHQAVIELGPAAVPLILQELEARHGHWFEALRSITQADPARKATSISEAREAWLQWGRQLHLL